MAKKNVRNSTQSSDILEFKITLRRIKPKIWRQIAVPSNYSLANLHEVILKVMGWDGYHLHQFLIDNQYFSSEESGDGFESEDIEESSVILAQLFKGVGAKFMYEYDFGDGWEHELKLMKIYPAKPNTIYPVCLAGERACPPEDCGGPWGYADMLNAVSNPEHPEHENMLDWLGGEFDPEEFDLDLINESLRKQQKRANIIPFPGLPKARK